MTEIKLDDSVRWIKGVGPKRAKLLSRCGVKTIRDFLYLSPRRYLDRSQIKKIKDVEVGGEVTIEGDVVSVNSRKSRKNTLISDVVIYDGTGMIKGRWFNQKWVEDSFKRGDHIYVSGKIDYYRGLQIVNPDYEFLSKEESEQIHTGRIIPVYPLTKGLGQRFMRKTINTVIKKVKDNIEDPLTDEIIKRHKLMSLNEAILKLHFPEDINQIEDVRRRLAFDELLNFQLFLFILKRQTKKMKGFSFNVDSKFASNFVSTLPFELTESQEKVLREIKRDMKFTYPMKRLLQGDVGSGKTIVAIVAMLICIDNGFNSVLMAPTEILAYQHYYVIKNFLYYSSIPVWLLHGGMNVKDRERILKDIKERRGIVIGTHALLEEDVEIPFLGLVIIDEQHRFGVTQRAVIQRKGDEPDVLVMTATPIPRTLAHTIYGDLEVSTIDEMPPGVKPSISRWVREEAKRKEVYSWVRKKVVDKGVKVYVVLPLIEESDKLDLRSIEEEADLLKDEFFSDFKVGILHGRMKGEDKERVMEGFRDSEYDILVTTTVIEVGIDIPEANIMIVENADRFGLSQLHQMRGRIGRAGDVSYFIMIANDKSITDNARTRLESLEELSDGFKLAEVDMFLRGPGEFFGTKQHGFPDFRFFEPLRDRKMIGRVRNSVNMILDKGLEDRFTERLKRVRNNKEFLEVS